MLKTLTMKRNINKKKININGYIDQIIKDKLYKEITRFSTFSFFLKKKMAKRYLIYVF